MGYVVGNAKKESHGGYHALQPKYYFNFHEWVDLFITLYWKLPYEGDNNSCSCRY